MDIKLKNNKDKYIITTITILIILVSSIGILFSYPMIKNKAEKIEINPFENTYFIRGINRANYSLYYSLMEEKIEENLKPSNVYINKDTLYNVIKENNINYDSVYCNQRVTNIIDNMNNEINRWKREQNSSWRNLEYYVIDNESKISISNKTHTIEKLLEKNSKENSNDSIKSNYKFYIIINYNENGRMTIESTYGVDARKFEHGMNEDNHYNVSINDFVEKYGYDSDNTINNIKNTTFIYGVPNELQFEDNVNYYINKAMGDKYILAGEDFIIIALCFVLILALLIPLKYERKIIGFEKVTKVPFEILVFVVIWSIMLFSISPEQIMRGTLDGSWFNYLIDLGIPHYGREFIINSTNIIYFSAVFGVFFLAMVMVKNIISLGLINYFRNRTLTYKLLRLIYKGFAIIRRSLSIGEIDLSDNNNKKIIKVLGINLVIMVLMCSAWFFGIIGAIIYTLVLFKLIKKHYVKFSREYNNLLNITRRIGEGNLDTNANEDLGIFNTIKDELANIQKGFKYAVDEEVKSQKMKTELISNVSHDLKTPLTSIITYVDLLKDPNLSDEKRSLYLDTVDRKSQRLQELIEDLFEVSKVNSGNVTLNIVDIDVVSLMKQTILELDDKISKSSLIIKSNYPDNKVILPLDSQRMFRVFENLIVNITKYAMPNSRVYIDVIDTEDKVEVSLKNMSASEINFNVDEIVERFVRGDKSRSTQGAGLGLAIAKSFVEIQKGKLDVIVDGDLFKVIITFNKE